MNKPLDEYGNYYDAPTECPDCGGHKVNVPSMALGIGIDGHECRDCGNVAAANALKSFVPNGLVTLDEWQEAEKKQPFTKRSKKELHEMLIALELLMEYSETLPYVAKLQDDLQEALAKK